MQPLKPNAVTFFGENVRFSKNKYSLQRRPTSVLLKYLHWLITFETKDDLTLEERDPA